MEYFSGLSLNNASNNYVVRVCLLKTKLNPSKLIKINVFEKHNIV